MKQMNLSMWWKIYPLKYKLAGALISILVLGVVLIGVFSFINVVAKYI